MKLIRSLVLVVLCHFIFLSNTLLADVIEVELLADKNYMPYSYLEDGEVRGIYPDIIRAAFSLMPNYKLKLTAVDRIDGISSIQNGDALGLIGVYVRGQDMQSVYPFSFPIGRESVVTICHQKVPSVSTKVWPNDYQSLLVGNIEGFDGWLNYQVRSQNKTKGINFLEVPTTDIAFNMVSRGRLDCSLFDEAAYYYSVKKHKSDKSTIDNTYTQPVMGTLVFSRPIHIGYSRKGIKDKKFPHAFDLQHALDGAIYTLEESGKSASIRKKYTSIALSPFK